MHSAARLPQTPHTPKGKDKNPQTKQPQTSQPEDCQQRQQEALPEHLLYAFTAEGSGREHLY